jgi:hypothetical protein
MWHSVTSENFVGLEEEFLNLLPALGIVARFSRTFQFEAEEL